MKVLVVILEKFGKVMCKILLVFYILKTIFYINFPAGIVRITVGAIRMRMKYTERQKKHHFIKRH